VRVFGIGLSRTGTSSLNAGLCALGWRARHFPSLRLLIGRLNIRLREFRRYDAMTDLPVALFFRELDRRFPGSKFVHTVRDVDAWLDSCERYRRFAPDFKPSKRVLELRRRVYDGETFDRDRFREAHARHTRAVREWFADRPDDLLELNVCAGEGFEKLCPFLGLPAREGAFPHKNANRVPNAG